MPSLKVMAREVQNVPKLRGAVSNPSAGRKSAPVFKSTETVADSDLESETESDSGSESAQKLTKTALPIKKYNGSKALQDDEESEETDGQEEYLEDEEIEHEEQEEEVEGRRQAKNGQADDIESDIQSTSGDSSGSETDQEEESITQNIDDTMPRSCHASEEQVIQSAPREPTAPYNPPKGFELLSTDGEARTKVVDVFSSSNLAGKQLWYLTVPAAVPISSVEEVSLEKVRLGKPALSLNGREYCFVHENTENRGRNSFLIPDETQTVYCIGEKEIDQTLHLQEVVKINEFSTNNISQAANSQNLSNNQSRTTIHSKRPARKQPRGLRMRFCPIGFGKGKPGTIGSRSSCSDASGSSTDSDAS